MAPKKTTLPETPLGYVSCKRMSPTGPILANSIGRRLGVLGSQSPGKRWEARVLWTIFVILLILWLLGFFAFHVAGGLIHLLLVIAIVVVLLRIISGRRPVV